MQFFFSLQRERKKLKGGRWEKGQNMTALLLLPVSHSFFSVRLVKEVPVKRPPSQRSPPSPQPQGLGRGTQEAALACRPALLVPQGHSPVQRGGGRCLGTALSRTENREPVRIGQPLRRPSPVSFSRGRYQAAETLQEKETEACVFPNEPSSPERPREWH